MRRKSVLPIDPAVMRDLQVGQLHFQAVAAFADFCVRPIRALSLPAAVRLRAKPPPTLICDPRTRHDRHGFDLHVYIVNSQKTALTRPTRRTGPRHIDESLYLGAVRVSPARPSHSSFDVPTPTFFLPFFILHSASRCARYKEFCFRSRDSPHFRHGFCTVQVQVEVLRC